MAEDFFSFLRQTRSEIGLTDVYNLGEIYDSDERFALSNIFLDPDGLDQIYELSRGGVVKEDIRTIGGVVQSVIHSVTLTKETLERVDFNLSQQLTTDKALGDPGKHSFVTDASSDNVIILHGGIAANSIEYKFLDENGELRTTTVPTSRESLFNSQKNVDGRFTSASYPGLFRIRRRSHFNTLRLDSSLLIPADTIVESPTDTLNIPIYMRTPANTSPAVNLLQCYATKNSPLILRVRISNSASFSIKRAVASLSPFVFGYELKRRSDLALVRSQVISDSGGRDTVPISISTDGTIGDNTDCMLYIYLDPTQVTDLNISGLGLVEDAGKDIGLVGFNNLERLNFSSNRLSTLPVWLKTLNEKLKYLNISGNSWRNNGLVQYFDYQDMNGGETVPQLTGIQILAYSGYDSSGKIAAYDGSYATAQDSAGNLYKDYRRTDSGTINAANGFRVFDQVEELILGGSIRCKNADFSKIFPNLQSLSINDQNDKNLYSEYIPKLRNNGQFFGLSFIGQFNLTGGINYLGDTLVWDDSDSASIQQQFVGQFKIGSINLNGTRITGGILTNAHVAPGSDVTAAWSGWLENLQTFNSYYQGAIAFKLAEGRFVEWKKLQSINISHNARRGGQSLVEYNSDVSGTNEEEANDVINAPQLTSIEAYNAGWYGKVPSIEQAPNLTHINIGSNNWDGYTALNGLQYILPSNFAPSNKSSALEFLYIHDMDNGGNNKLEFREDDFDNLPSLYYFYVKNSYFRGKLPNISDNSYTSGVNNMHFYIHNNRFRDVSSLGKSKRIYLIYSPNQGVSMGGCLLPQFNLKGGNNNLYDVRFGESLRYNYPSNWKDSSKRNKPIAPIFLGTEEKETLSEVTWTVDANEPDKLNVASGSANLSANILVGDEVWQGSNNLNARVTQVDYENNFIYITNGSTGLSGATLSFKRRGQDISSYFNNYSKLRYLYISNNRLSGAIPSFLGCTSLQNVDLYSNLFTTYKKGTLQNITGSGSINRSASLSRFYAYSNPLSVQSIRNLIEDAYECAQYFAEKRLIFNVKIDIKSTKYDPASGLFINYTQNEIFNQTSTSTDPATDETITIEDPLLLKYNQLGPGNTFSGVRVEIF